MRTATRLSLLTLVALVAAAATFGVIALTRDGGGAVDAARAGATAGAAPGRAGAPGATRAVAAPGVAAGSPATAGLPRLGGATTSDAVVVWTGRGNLPPGTARSGRGPGTRVSLYLTVTAAPGRGSAVVRARNPTARRIALTGTLQLLVSGPGAPVVTRQRLNHPLAPGSSSTVTMAFLPGPPGIYRVRAVFSP
jgi:hypothetical protein